MLFKEAKEFLNNKGYKLVESEFRDPSNYASFYYPPEGPDTEEHEEDALNAASEEINSAVESIAEGLKEKYSHDNSGVELSVITGGWTLTPKIEYWEVLKERYGNKNMGRLSRSASRPSSP